MLPVLPLWLGFAALAFAGSSKFTLDLTWKTGAPDGFQREMIFINGQFPGPTLEIQQGDWVEIVVNNHLSANTSIHAHGIDQFNTPEADGVPGLSQRNILPGESFTCKWKADQYGSYFYHAHSKGQVDDGAHGPIIIKPKAGLAKPFDKIAPGDVKALEAAEAKVAPLLLTDWRHFTSDRIFALSEASGFESSICMDALLVNGKGAVECWPREDIDKYVPPGFAPLLKQMNLKMTNKGCLPAELLGAIGGTPFNVSVIPPEVFNVCTPTKGSREVIKAPKNEKWLALDIISTASTDSFAVSIDAHPMWIYAVDGHYIEPLKADAIPVNNGDRYSVFIELDKPSSNYGIRIASTAAAQLMDHTAILSYEGNYGGGNDGPVTSTPSITRNGLPVSNNVTFFQQSKMVSFPPQFPQPAPDVDQTIIMELQNAGNSYTWGLNKIPFDHSVDNLEPPLLYQPPDSHKTNETITITTKNGTWVDLIFTLNQVPQPAHPMHKHSNKAFVIGSGTGAWKWKTVAEAQKEVPDSFNLVTPAYRDGFMTPPAETGPSWLAVRYQVVNPGAFLLHCHIQSHLTGGMAMVILDGVDEWPECFDKKVR